MICPLKLALFYCCCAVCVLYWPLLVFLFIISLLVLISSFSPLFLSRLFFLSLLPLLLSLLLYHRPAPLLITITWGVEGLQLQLQFCVGGGGVMIARAPFYPSS